MTERETIPAPPPAPERTTIPAPAWWPDAVELEVEAMFDELEDPAL